MKICYVSALWNEPEAGGGVYSYLHLTAREIAKLGNDVTVVTAGNPGEKIENRVRVVQIAKLNILKTSLEIISPVFIYKRVKYLFGLTSYVISHRFDIIEVPDGGFEHLFLVFVSKCAIVTRMHGRTSDTKRIKMKKALNFIENIAIRKSNGLSIPSKSYYSLLDKSLLRNKLTQVIPYGIEPCSGREKSSLRKKYNLGKKKIILIVGTISYRKGFDVILKLAKQMTKREDIIFILVGPNGGNYNLEKLPQNVYCVGYKNMAQTRQFINECDVMLSASRFETFGIGVAEALMCGKPVVASNIDGLKDLVKEGINGYLFNVGDIKRAKVGLFKILDNSVKRKKMGQESLALAKNFTIDKVSLQTLLFYKKVISNYEKN